jgi:hypothetical protein
MIRRRNGDLCVAKDTPPIIPTRFKMFDFNSLNSLVMLQAIQQFNRPVSHRSQQHVARSSRSIASRLAAWLKTRRVKPAMPSKLAPENIPASRSSAATPTRRAA